MCTSTTCTPKSTGNCCYLIDDDGSLPGVQILQVRLILTFSLHLKKFIYMYGTYQIAILEELEYHNLYIVVIHPENAFKLLYKRSMHQNCQLKQ